MPTVQKCPNPSCRKDIGIPESSAGKKVICPFCKQQFVAGGKAEPSAPTRTASSRMATTRPGLRGRSKKPGRADGSRSGRRERGRGRRGDDAAEFEERPYTDRPAPFLGLSPEALKIIRISCLVVAVLGAIVGGIELMKKFSRAGGNPQQLILDATIAVRTEDDGRLWRLLTNNDQRTAEANQADFRTFLTSSAGLSETDVGRMGPRRLLLACLQSHYFRTHSWKFVGFQNNDNTGLVLFNDDAGSTRSMRVVRTSAGWRLALAEFCLKTVEAVAAAEAEELIPDEPEESP